MSIEQSASRPHFLGLADEWTSLDRARFVILPIPYERSTSYLKGTREGPQAVINASHQLEPYDEELGIETFRRGIHTMAPPTILNDPIAFFTSIGNIVEPLVRMGKFVVAVGGEHSISEGPLAGIQRVHPKVSVLHFGAHADRRESFQGFRTSHACAVHRMSEYVERVVQVGIRSLSRAEAESPNKKVRSFPRHEYRDVAAMIPQVIDALGDPVYLSIDLGGFDPSVIPGVGTPQPGGFTWMEGLDILRAACHSRNVVGASVVELTPLGDGVASEFTAAKLIYRLMGYVAVREAVPKPAKGKTARPAKARK